MWSVCFCFYHLSYSWGQDNKMWKEQSKSILTSGNTLIVGFSLMVVFWKTHVRICMTTVYKFLCQSRARDLPIVTELCHQCFPERECWLAKYLQQHCLSTLCGSSVMLGCVGPRRSQFLLISIFSHHTE